MHNIVFIGDSLTEYYDWQKRFPGYHVINLGIGGETAEGLKGRLDRVILSLQNPDCFFIMTGINNIAMEDYDIVSTYKRIINKLFSSFGKTAIVVQSILPVNLSWVDNNRIREINGALKEIANNFTAGYLDLYSLFVDGDGKPVGAYLLDDGVHLSDEGYKVWAKEIEEFLQL